MVIGYLVRVGVRIPVLRARGRGCPRAAGADHLSNSETNCASQRPRTSGYLNDDLAGKLRGCQ